MDGTQNKINLKKWRERSTIHFKRLIERQRIVRKINKAISGVANKYWWSGDPTSSDYHYRKVMRKVKSTLNARLRFENLGSFEYWDEYLRKRSTQFDQRGSYTKLLHRS